MAKRIIKPEELKGQAYIHFDLTAKEKIRIKNRMGLAEINQFSEYCIKKIERIFSRKNLDVYKSTPETKIRHTAYVSVEAKEALKAIAKELNITLKQLILGDL